MSLKKLHYFTLTEITSHCITTVRDGKLHYTEKVSIMIFFISQ